MSAIQAARSLFEAGEAGVIDSWLDPAVELRPPTYGKSWHGQSLVARLLGFAADAMTDFRYTDIVGEQGLHVMRFEARIDDGAISGVDILRCNEAGAVTQFEIFARPPKAVLALRDAMGARVAADPEAARLMGLA